MRSNATPTAGLRMCSPMTCIGWAGTATPKPSKTLTVLGERRDSQLDRRPPRRSAPRCDRGSDRVHPVDLGPHLDDDPRPDQPRLGSRLRPLMGRAHLLHLVAAVVHLLHRPSAAGRVKGIIA